MALRVVLGVLVLGALRIDLPPVALGVLILGAPGLTRAQGMLPSVSWSFVSTCSSCGLSCSPISLSLPSIR